MTQEEKELVIKDLCGRLPYGVMLKHISTEKPFKLFSIKRDEYASYKKDGVELAVNGVYYDWYVNDIYHDIELYIKPYLRPLSSMTDEEREEYSQFISEINGCAYFIDPVSQMDWLNKNMFDYRGLIEKGLALEAPKDIYEHEVKSDVNEIGSRIGVGCKIRSKTNPNEILTIISDDCHGDEFECANGDVLSLKQIEKYYDIIT